MYTVMVSGWIQGVGALAIDPAGWLNVGHRIEDPQGGVCPGSSLRNLLQPLGLELDFRGIDFSSGTILMAGRENDVVERYSSESASVVLVSKDGRSIGESTS